MAKKIKIKRYNGIYRNRRSPWATLLLILVWLLVLAVLVAIGFSLYQTVMDYIEQRPSSPSQSDPSSAFSSSSVSQPVEQSAASQPEPEAPEVIRAVYASHTVYSDAEQWDQFLRATKAMGANTVVVEYKDEQGMVYHTSSVSAAVEGFAISPQAVDLAQVVQTIREYDMIPAASIYGFEDHTVSYQLREMAVWYAGSEYLWYDNSPSDGGQPWLNPYHSQAQQYLIQLAQEAAGLGFEQIWMAGLHFPTGYQLEYIDFGDTDGVSKSQLLGAFSQTLQDSLAEYDASLSVVVSVSDVISPNGFTYGEQSALELFDSKIYLDFTDVAQDQLEGAAQQLLSDEAYGAVMQSEAMQSVLPEDMSSKDILVLSGADGYSANVTAG